MEHRRGLYYLERLRLRYVGIGENYSARLLLFSSYTDYPENTDVDAETPMYPIAPFTEQSSYVHPILDSVAATQLMARNISSSTRTIDRSIYLSKRPVASVTGRPRRIKYYYLALVTHSQLLGQLDIQDPDNSPEWYNVNLYLDLTYRVSQ